MAGFTYTVTQAGAKATSAVPSGWTTSATCWIIKRAACADPGVTLIEAWWRWSSWRGCHGHASFTAWNQRGPRACAGGVDAGRSAVRQERGRRLNGQVRFQLTTSIDATCALSVTGTAWVVDAVDADPATDSVEGRCNATPSARSLEACRSARDEAGAGTAVSADQSSIVFGVAWIALCPCPPERSISKSPQRIPHGAPSTQAAA